MQQVLQRELCEVLHRMARCASLIIPTLSLAHSLPAIAADGSETAQAQTHPPAYLHCSLKVGESSLLEGPCRVTTLTGSRILIEAEGQSEMKLLVVPEDQRDRILWNGGVSVRGVDQLLGVGQWVDNCWRNVVNSDPPFYLCLISPKG
ncbi:MAG: hypothetical protein RLZZ136_1380 [Pseudomonadota bacterium]